MNDQDKAQAIERANAYRTMLQSWTWKDFDKFLSDTRQSALEKGIHVKDSDERNAQRGIVICIDSIRAEIDYIINGTIRE